MKTLLLLLLASSVAALGSRTNLSDKVYFLDDEFTGINSVVLHSNWLNRTNAERCVGLGLKKDVVTNGVSMSVVIEVMGRHTLLDNGESLVLVVDGKRMFLVPRGRAIHRYHGEDSYLNQGYLLDTRTVQALAKARSVKLRLIQFTEGSMDFDVAAVPLWRLTKFFQDHCKENEYLAKPEEAPRWDGETRAARPLFVEPKSEDVFEPLADGGTRIKGTIMQKTTNDFSIMVNRFGSGQANKTVVIRDHPGHSAIQPDQPIEVIGYSRETLRATNTYGKTIFLDSYSVKPSGPTK